MKNLKKNFCKVSILTISACTLFACSSGDDSKNQPPVQVTKTNVSGIIEKGPFVQGSKVTLYELESNLSQTGKSFKTQTSSDLGVFQLDSPIQLNSQYVELETSGYFYNEVKGNLSTSQITLNALSDVTNRNSVNVNLITHLEYGRVKRLVQNGQNFAAAKSQAEKELLACFAITDEISQPENISVKDNNKGSAILLAISCIMLYDKSEAQFTEFISKFSTDFADNGMIDASTILDEITVGKKNIHPSEIINRMKEFYAEKGTTIECDDFSKYIDFNGDGVIDENDQEEDTTPSEMTEETYLTTEEAVQSAITGIYAQLASFETYQLALEAVRLGKIDGNQYGIDLKYTSDNTIYKAWGLAYAAIARANAMLKVLRENDNYDIAPYVAEITALRSFVYYNLAVLWGNVPMPTGEEGMLDVVPQKNQREVLQYALTTLQEVLPKFANVYPSETSKYHFDAICARVLLAELSLTLNNVSDAKSHLQTIGQAGSVDFPINVSSMGSDVSYAFANAIQNGDWYSVYTPDYFNLLTDEANGNKDGLADAYFSSSSYYGIWAALKRLGATQCEEYELLLPIPQQELSFNLYITQNPGY